MYYWSYVYIQVSQMIVSKLANEDQAMKVSKAGSLYAQPTLLQVGTD